MAVGEDVCFDGDSIADRAFDGEATAIQFRGNAFNDPPLTAIDRELGSFRFRLRFRFRGSGGGLDYDRFSRGGFLGCCWFRRLDVCRRLCLMGCRLGRCWRRFSAAPFFFIHGEFLGHAG